MLIVHCIKEINVSVIYISFEESLEKQIKIVFMITLNLTVFLC